MNKPDRTISTIIIVLAIILAYSGYVLISRLNSSQKEVLVLRSELQETTDDLNRAEGEKNLLYEQLESERGRNDALEKRVEEAEEVLGIITKKQNTDPELLQKYSKVYFLNEHYRPEEMDKIPSKWVVEGRPDQFIHEKVFPFLKEMLEEADDENINLRVISAFRSFDEQSTLKNQYTTVYGSGANQFSADQGYSEHQLGTTVDLSTEELSESFTNIDQTEAFNWLEKNAYKYGFILSYPPNNSYYQYEPWHWRFVGTKLAKDLHRNNQYFYDLDQREIDEYITELFD